MIKRPMLAATCLDNGSLFKNDKLWMASPKLDGIRCLIVNGEVLSRKFKVIPNRFIQTTLKSIGLNGMDGEIICPGKTFNETQSAVMSEDGTPSFEYHVFDFVTDSLETDYLSRMVNLTMTYQSNEYVKILYSEPIGSLEKLTVYEEKQLKAGYEGVMVRKPNSPYKEGRSTLKEGYLLKIKRFSDSEAIILECVEQMTNTNEKELDNFGNTKRSSKKAGKVAGNTLGAFKVRDVVTNVEFEIGTGLIKEQRQDI